MDADVSLRTDQVADLAVYIQNPRTMNLSEPGTGKTPSVCTMQWYLWSENQIGTVWVMPKSLLKKNKDELHRFTPFEDDQVVIVDDPKTLWPTRPAKPDGPPPEPNAARLLVEKLRRGEQSVRGGEKVTLRNLMKHGFVRADLTVDEEPVQASITGVPRALLSPGRAVVFLMGFDRFAMSWSNLPAFVKALHVDEIHKGFGHNSSWRTQQMYEFMKPKDRQFLPMTGTLIDGRLDTAYPTIKVVEPRYYPTYNSFYYYHAVEDPISGKLSGWKNHEKLALIFGKHGIRRTFEMVFGKQAVVVIPEVVEMSDAQREIYDQFKEQAFLELEQFFIDGTQPGVAFIRARQIMEHPNRFPDLRDPGSGKFVDIMKGALPGKMERLDLHFTDHERTGKPIIVFASQVPQQYQIAELAEKLGLKPAVMNGDVSAPARSRIDKAFRAGEIDTIVGSWLVADVGFNWQFCGQRETDHIVSASLGYKDTTFIQAVWRAIRGKRSCPLRVTVLKYRDSLDQRLEWIVHKKSVDAHRVDPTRPIVDLSKYGPLGEQLREAA